jgi:uncharacterized membrane protein YedE/YeeE
MKIIFAALSGLVFGLGLIVAGMANPAKVQAFLDLGGAWDPSLALVMAGAIGAAILPFSWVRRHSAGLGGQPVQWPQAKAIDRRLLLGSLVFGAGWGLAGICPGPALVLLGSGSFKGLIFVLAMLAGMLLHRWRESRTVVVSAAAQ